MDRLKPVDPDLLGSGGDRRRHDRIERDDLRQR
jgi:hypothetical protein